MFVGAHQQRVFVVVMQERDVLLDEYYKRYDPDMGFMEPILSMLDLELFQVSGQLRGILLQKNADLRVEFSRGEE